MLLNLELNYIMTIRFVGIQAKFKMGCLNFDFEFEIASFLLTYIFVSIPSWPWL